MEYAYSAFISYRHLPDDIAAAKAVQRAIETFHTPRDIQKKTGVKKLKRCFRDQDELPLADDLGSSIEKALRESECLIVICTPDLPQSRWCCREVEYFIELGKRDKIIPVLVKGEPSESYPPQITYEETEHGREEIEPLAADIRGNLRKKLKTEKLRIIARMLNLDFNDLKKRERERALRRGLVFVSAVLAVVIAFAGYALYQNRLLTAERNATTRNATELLLEKSVRSTTEGEMGIGLSYALKAYEDSRIFEDEYDAAVFAALEAAMYPEMYSQIGTLKDNGILHRWAALSNDGKLIACRQSDDSLMVYSSVTGERLYTIKNSLARYKTGRDISPDGKYVCQLSDVTIRLYNSADGTLALSTQVPDGWEIEYKSLTSRNEIPVIRTEDKAIALFDPFTQKLTMLDDIHFEYATACVEIHRSGLMGAFYDGGDTTYIVDLEKQAIVKVLPAQIFYTLGGYTADEQYFQYWDNSDIHFLRWDTLEEVRVLDDADALSPDGKTFVTTNSFNGFSVGDAETGEILWTSGHDYAHNVYEVYFWNNDILIASHGEVQIYNVKTQEVLYDSGTDQLTYGLDFAAGRLVMALRSGGCLVNLLPAEEDIVPHLEMVTRNDITEEDMFGITDCFPLAGTWEGSVYYLNVNGEFFTIELPEPGLVYIWHNQEFILHPTRGMGNPFIYVSPDGQWQAMIRGEEVDIFRAQEGPEPVMTIPGNGYNRLCAGFYGNTIALGSYVENLVLYDLISGECIGTVKTGAMCADIQFSPDGKHVMALSAMAAQATVANTDNLAVIMRIPVTDIYQYQSIYVGFNEDGSEAIVLYPDGHSDVGLMYQGLDTLVERAKRYM